MFKKIRNLLVTGIFAAALAVSGAAEVSAAVDTAATADTYPVDSDQWAGWPQAPALLGVTGCLYDVNTGTVLYAKGMDVQRFPASITKIMTALVVMEHADLNAQVSFTETGLADAYGGSSNCNPKLGETFTVDQLLQLLLVKSANDAAAQLAESVGGSVENFAAMMNQKAEELGCTNTHFVNASGLEDDNHYTSAHDMALIMNAALKQDRIREIMNAQSITIPATNMSESRYYETHLQMLVPGNEYYYEGAFGGKTGYTPISGCTLVMSATRGDRTLIGVVMGGGDSNLICLDMADLFNYGFDSFSYTDMTGGYPYISGGAALLPNGQDPSAVEILPQETAEGVALTYQFNGQNFGGGLMAADAYAAWQKSLQPEEENVQETLHGQENPGQEGASDPAGNAHKGKRILMYIAIGILLISVICCIILIVLTSESYQKKMRRKRRDGRKR